MAEGGHTAVPFTFSARKEFGAVVDGLAKRRGLNRSAFIRELVTEEALRLAQAEKERKRG
jgi:Ribbon-helix-helix protein, copG family